MAAVAALHLAAPALASASAGVISKDSEVQSLISRAQRSYDLAQFTEAANDYAEAYERAELPALLFNLGQCHRQRGEHERAAHFFRRYLERSPAGRHVPHARALLAQLEEDRPRAEPARPTSGLLPPGRASGSADVPLAGAHASPLSPAPDPAPGLGVRPEGRHVTQRWWFWTAVGAAVASGAAVAISAHDGRRGASPPFALPVPSSAPASTGTSTEGATAAPELGHPLSAGKPKKPRP